MCGPEDTAVRHGVHNHDPFRPAWWLPGAHLQTLWANLLRRVARPALQRERLELADGDFLDLDWADEDTDDTTTPLILVLHGLEGSADSRYVRGLMHSLRSQGLRAVVMHFRGCSGIPNRLARSYHSGETGDLDSVIRHLRVRHPDAPLAAVGYSLGGNVLLKYLGERGHTTDLCCAVAVSVPMLLERAAWRMARGASRLYQWHLLTQLRRSLREKFTRRTLVPPMALKELRKLRTFYQFDDAITAPLHGFFGADDYYARASSRPYLKNIAIPTLVIHAQDDPFMTPDVLPPREALPSSVTLEVSRHGGHVGFVSGPPWTPRYWLEQRIPTYLCQKIRQHDNAATSPPLTPHP